MVGDEMGRMTGEEVTLREERGTGMGMGMGRLRFG